LLFDFYFRHAWRVQRKHAFDALTVRDTPHSESLIESAAFSADHYAGKDLDSFLISLYDARVHAHAIPNRKRVGITFLLFFLDGIDDLVHKVVAIRAAAGAHSASNERVLQPEIVNHLNERTKHLDGHNVRKLVKICRICG
jgi:hypothetical protein